MNDAQLIGLVAVLIYIWCDTDAVVEYARVFKLKSLKYEDFDAFKKTNFGITYFDYLLLKYNCFWTRLITCPICFSVWVNIYFCAVFWKWPYLGVNILLTWFIYYLLGILSKVANE